MQQIVKGHIIFDHDGTLVSVERAGMSLFPGMLELIENLKSENYEVYVWTARDRRSTLQSIKQNNISHLITDIYCSDDGISKPHPMGPSKLTDGIDKKKIIHIGDSMSDWEGSKNYGIDFIYAAWANHDAGHFFKTLTPYVAFNLNDCKKLIELKFN